VSACRLLSGRKGGREDQEPRERERERSHKYLLYKINTGSSSSSDIIKSISRVHEETDIRYVYTNFINT